MGIAADETAVNDVRSEASGEGKSLSAIKSGACDSKR